MDHDDGCDRTDGAAEMAPPLPAEQLETDSVAAAAVPPPLPLAASAMWKRVAMGFLPAAAILLVLVGAITLDPGGDVALPLLILAGVVFVAGTPLAMIPWSSSMLKHIHGPVTEATRSYRMGMVAVVTLAMCAANFFIVFAGCTAVLLVAG